MKIILFQGDSITDGNRYKLESQRWDLNHQIGHCYVYPIAAEYGATYPKLDFHFYNRGVSGNSVWNLKERWQTDTLDLKPDILSILIGTNDMGYISNYGNDPDKLANAYEDTYNEILEQFRTVCPKSHIVIIEPFRLPAGSMEQSEKFVEAMKILNPIAKASKRIADKSNAIFIPMQKRFEELCKVREPKYWVWDGIHPTESGHFIIAKAWMEAVHNIMFIN